MNRMGLVDFWCYENEVFEFDDGHILLRGTNGSGKSVTLQSFIPLLLDGNKSSERLDTFGSNSRKMDTYLIDETTDRDERIGYLWLEFKKASLDLYMTIGMGLRAKRNKPLQSWYFVIEDNRRIEKDIFLMENHLTLSLRQLKNILGNQVIEKQADYMRKVNDVLFGFESIDDYKDALNLLLQLRMPKLSNSLSPDKLNEFLSKSLRPLSEEDLRPMSEAMHNMDNLQDELDTLKQSEAALTKICDHYKVYNEAQLIEKYFKYSEQAKLLNECKENLHEIKNKEDELTCAKNKLEETLKSQQIDIEILGQEKQSLLSQDINKLHEELMDLERDITNLNLDIERKNGSLDTKNERKKEIDSRVRKVENEEAVQQRAYQKALKELNVLYDTFPFSEHSIMKEAIEKKKEFNFAYTKLMLKNELAMVRECLNLWLQMDNIDIQKGDIENDLLSTEYEIENQTSKIQQAEKAYEEIIKEYQEHFYKLASVNKHLKLNQTQLNGITNCLLSYEQQQDYLSINKIIQDVYWSVQSSLQNTLNHLRFDKDMLEKNAMNIIKEIEDWRNRKEIEPERNEEILENRKALASLGIAYQPFYKLIEFKSGMSEDEKNKLENLLVQMKLLDALVVHENDREIILNLNHQDYYLWTTKAIDSNDIIEIEIDHLIDVFKQLEITNSHEFNINSNYFESGVIYGTYHGNQQAKFIGVANREQLREQKIQLLLNELEECRQKIAVLNQQIEYTNQQLEDTKNEYKSFKTEDDLKLAYKMVEDEKNNCQQLLRQKDRLTSQIKELELKIAQIKRQIQEIAQKILVKADKEILENLRVCIEDYQSELDKLENGYKNYLHFNELLSSLVVQLNEVNEDIDELIYEKEEMETKLAVQQGKYDNIYRQLEDKGYHHIQQRLLEIEKLLIELKRAYQIGLEKRGYYESEIEKVINLKGEGEQRLIKQEYNENIYLDLLNQELDYHFVFENDLSMKELSKEIRLLNSKMNQKKMLRDYETQLLSSFFEQNNYLAEYRPTRETNTLIHQVDDLNNRIILKAVHLGQSIPIEQLRTRLEENIEMQSLLIAQEDRKIFEDILVNTISKKIRAHIQTSKRWVEKMQHYMHDLNTSSGLQLSLKWQPKKSNTEDELDTSELVSLLDKDAILLKERDRQKISKHFKTKIEYARKLSEDENTMKSFHQLLKDVMNYRDWFDFTIYVQKPNESKRELTKKIFGAYSGGEKAIVMLVPLFSAVTAKLESARTDAPLLIALDEAFAGVDENNIDSLFELIEKFEFDYIMNSQVLWGDYPSCKSLAIYELFRPNNAPYVATVAYHWNGHQRSVKLNG